MIVRWAEERMARGAGPRLGARLEGWLGRRLVRRLAVPPGVRVVCVGGATLGGSGKTSLAIACAAHLAARGARVALVGHGYRARPLEPRVVDAADALDRVGDEALVAARALAGRAHVVVAPTRRSAVSHAARFADVLVLDGVHQLAPRAALALLAADAEAPWGSGAPVPRGDLSAPRATLLAACDEVVAVGDAELEGSAWARVEGARASRALELVAPDGALVAWAEARGRSWGLFTALARPERVAAALARRRLAIDLRVDAGDHGRHGVRSAPDAVAQRWIATEKCALHAPPWMRGSVFLLRERLTLPPSLLAGLDVVALPASARA